MPGRHVSCHRKRTKEIPSPAPGRDPFNAKNITSAHPTAHDRQGVRETEGQVASKRGASRFSPSRSRSQFAEKYPAK
jgi:hypothetical protein